MWPWPRRLAQGRCRGGSNSFASKALRRPRTTADLSDRDGHAVARGHFDLDEPPSGAPHVGACRLRCSSRRSEAIGRAGSIGTVATPVMIPRHLGDPSRGRRGLSRATENRFGFQIRPLWPPPRQARPSPQARVGIRRGGGSRRSRGSSAPDRAPGAHFASYATRIGANSARLAPRRPGSGSSQRPCGPSDSEGNELPRCEGFTGRRRADAISDT
jgi:hypothetical protein